MTEQQEDQPKQLKRYRVQLDGNRGQAVMKLTEKDAERMGDRVLGEADSEQKTFGKPEEGRSTFADGTAGTGSTGGAGADPDAEPESEEEDAEPKAKAQTPANKSKPGRNK